MLDFGFSEILLTSAIALVVLGPERLPKVARQVGNWMGRARVMARQLSEQLEREVSAEEFLKEQSAPKPPAANRIAPPPAPYTPPTEPYAPPTAPYAPPQAGVVAGDPHAAPHAEYEPPTTVTVPTATPSND
jgi:sec-independent protein translocase protein TatB